MTRRICTNRSPGSWSWTPTLEERLREWWWLSRGLRVLLLASLIGLGLWIVIGMAVWFTLTRVWVSS